jgi:hypothetical protein
MFDVFYSGTKPNAIAHERPANSLEHAQQLSRTEYFWWITYLADLSNWGWLYEPAPWQANQRHAWPSQWQKDSGIYLVPKSGYIETNYHTSPVIQRHQDSSNWAIGPDVLNWDTSWHPDPCEPLYIHEFSTQWWDEGGPVYSPPGATERKYHASPCARLSKKHYDRVELLTDCVWDYSWQPHPKDPPYINVFGNQWWPAEVFPTVKYSVPGATEVKYVTHPQARLPEQRCNRWHTLVDCDWDYSWQPDPGDSPYIYVFGNQWWPAEIMPTVEYHVPGATERKYVSWPRARLIDISDSWTVPDGLEPFDLTWCPDPGDPPLIYQFGTQWQRTGGPVYSVTGATEVKYVQHPRAVKIAQDSNWTVPDGVDTSTFDWTWHPDATEPPYVYQFATQHQRTGGPQYSVPGATEVKYVDQIRIEITAHAAAIYEIDHMDGSAGQIPNTVKRVRYFDNYRDTLIRLAKSIGSEHEWVWVCSSICDYTGFDFSWHPEQWQATMLHVFRSNEQKFGDTFYMHVPTFAARAEKKALLEWYDVNFVDVSVPRRRLPVIEHASDSHVEVIKHTDWTGPLALFTTTGLPITIPTVPLWRAETKTIMPLSAGASAVIVPKAAKGNIKTQLYDYPYIDKTQRRRHSDELLDIVFISNGEPNAEVNWKRLSLLPKKNRTIRVDNINGRAAAYHAAARASNTPWFFAVFAKLAVDIDFDFSWQPDRMQQSKHYIFHAKNPVNGLEYGHQAMIAYNQELVLGNPGYGLDFTLDSAHEVVPINSGTAYYDYTPWMAWRTAFREAIKLRASLPDVENQYRLSKWLDINSDEADPQWSRLGAEDAVEYYEQVNGNPTELRKSYEWDWLASYAFVKRSLVPD